MVKTIATKSVRLLVTAVLALYMCVPLSAYAADLSTEDSTVEAKSVEGYVTASSTPASQAAPEILGLTGVDELTNSDPSIDDYTDSLKYIFFGTDEYNENANPYFYNKVYDTDGEQVIYNSNMRWNKQNSIAANPVRALAPYGGVDDTDDLVWEQLPDVIIGNEVADGEHVTYLEDEYAPAVEEALGLESGSYQPIAVEYTLNSMADIVDKTYGIAEAGEQVVEDSDGEKQLRYGSAVDIATNYEKYVKGTQGYILQALDEGTVEKKNVVVVESYADDQFTLTKTPSSWATGTRFLEITTLVADNLADDLDGDDAATVTREELAAMDVDLIILTSDAAENAEMGDLATKTYWASSNIAGAIYKVDANSVEIATNYGRILGCLYDEILDQSDLVAYYYDTFYHIKDSMLATAIDQGMDGVRNWAVQDGSGSELLTWDEEDVADYSQDEVQAILDAGVAYIYSLGEEADELVQLTDYIEVNGIDISDATVSFSIADGAASVSAVLSGTTLVEGTDYTVAYTNAAGETVTSFTDAGTYTATLTGTGTATDGYYGTATATYTVQAATGGGSSASSSSGTTAAKKAQSITVKAKKATTVKYSKLKKKAQVVKASKLYKVTGAKGKLSYSKVSVKKNGKKASKKVAKKITVSKTGKITLKKGLAKGTYKVKVKVKAAATSKYKASKAKNVTVTIKVK